MLYECFSPPYYFWKEIERMMNPINWSSKKNGTRSINWLEWEKITIQKDYGALTLCLALTDHESLPRVDGNWRGLVTIITPENQIVLLTFTLIFVFSLDSTSTVVEFLGTLYSSILSQNNINIRFCKLDFPITIVNPVLIACRRT